MNTFTISSIIETETVEAWYEENGADVIDRALARNCALDLLNAFREENDMDPLVRCPAEAVELALSYLQAIKTDEDGELQDEIDEEADEALEEVEADDEAELSGSVVKEAYKARYREEGHPDNCGDWLAIELEGWCKDDDDKFVLEHFATILEANGIDRPLPLVGNRGWQGRYRMSGRMALARVIADAGVLSVPAEITGSADTEIQVPAGFIAAHATRKKVKPQKGA